MIIISVLGILIFPYGIFNTMVSLKYETENPGDCISLVNGENLCEAIKNLKIYFIVCVLVLVCLLVFKKKMLKENVTLKTEQNK